MTTKEMSDFLNSLWCWARCTEEEQRKLSEIADYLSSRGNVPSELEKNSKKLEKNFGESDCISREATVKRLCNLAEYMNEHKENSGDPYIMVALFIQDNKTEFPSVTPQEPQSFKWCTDCKEYDLELHCCHRYSKVIRDTVAEIEQEPILDKIRAEVENINVWGMRYEPDTYLDKKPQIVQKVKEHVIEIIDKYKADKEQEDGNNRA